MQSRLYLLVASILLGSATLITAIVRLTEPVPVTPWESGVVMEGVRLNAGLPVYSADHATHMYGPLLTVLMAVITRITGLNLPAIRTIMSIFAIALAALLGWVLCGRGSRRYFVLAVLLFLGINLRTNLIYFSTQPDCIAALLGLTGLCLWIKRSSWIQAAIAVLLFVLAVFFKQTAAMFAAIPLLYESIWRRPVSVRKLAAALVPPMTISAAFVLVFLLHSQMFHAIVTVPATIKLYPARIPRVSLYLIATFPIILVALLSVVRSREPLTDEERWIVAALFVFVPTSIWTICKSGAGENSLLPAYLAMTALFVTRLNHIDQWIESFSSPRRFAGASLLILAILFSFFIQFDRVARFLLVRSGDEKYELAIKVAQRVGAISPQDPTIAYRANGYIGHCLFFELDTHAKEGNWPAELPVSIAQELRSANFVLFVNSFIPTLFERGLRKQNFEPLAGAELEGSAYSLWTRAFD